MHQRIKLDRWGVRRDDGATSGGSPGGGRVDPLRLSWVPAGVPVRAGALRAASACFSCGTRVRLTGAQALLPYLVLSTRLARARPPPPPSYLCRSTGWSRTADRPALPALALVPVGYQAPASAVSGGARQPDGRPLAKRCPLAQRPYPCTPRPVPLPPTPPRFLGNYVHLDRKPECLPSSPTTLKTTARSCATAPSSWPHHGQPGHTRLPAHPCHIQRCWPHSGPCQSGW